MLERERDAALNRLTKAFSAVNSAQGRWRQQCDAEEAALETICAYRCATPDHTARKFGYLWKWRDALTDEQREAVFASLLPESFKAQEVK